MTIERKQDGNDLTLIINGRIDSNSSSILQKDLLDALENFTQIVLDFKDVAYISSAGLRVLLIGQKTATSKNSKMELSNVSQLVMQVLETVGFAKILSFK